MPVRTWVNHPKELEKWKKKKVEQQQFSDRLRWTDLSTVLAAFTTYKHFGAWEIYCVIVYNWISIIP